MSLQHNQRRVSLQHNQRRVSLQHNQRRVSLQHNQRRVSLQHTRRVSLEEGEPTAQPEESEPTTQPEEGEPTAQPEEGEPTTQPEKTLDFEPEEQLSLNDSDTTQEGTIGGSQTPTAIPRRRLPQEPIRVGLPRVEGEAEKEEVVEEEDSEAFEQVRPVKVTFVPDLSPK